MLHSRAGGDSERASLNAHDATVPQSRDSEHICNAGAGMGFAPGRYGRGNMSATRETLSHHGCLEWPECGRSLDPFGVAPVPHTAQALTPMRLPGTAVDLTTGAARERQRGDQRRANERVCPATVGLVPSRRRYSRLIRRRRHVASRRLITTIPIVVTITVDSADTCGIAKRRSSTSRTKSDCV